MSNEVSNKNKVDETRARQSKQAEMRRMSQDARGDIQSWLLSLPLTSNDPGASLRYIHDFVQAAALLDLHPHGLYCDFGAGSGWISEWLTSLGYTTIATDISHDMLVLAQKRYAERNLTPLLVVADGEALPFKPGVFDGVICVNAFHHLPNMIRALREIRLSLSVNGSAVFFEPGEGHSDDPRSKYDMQNLGVLEQDVTIEDMALMAREAGFSRGETALYTFPLPTLELANWPSFKDVHLHHGPDDGRRPDFLASFADHMRRHPLLRLSPLPFPHSRQPGILAAELSVEQQSVVVAASTHFRIDVRIRNTGNTLWLNQAPGGFGMVRLGAHLLDNNRTMKTFEFARRELEKSLMPGESTTIPLIESAPSDCGTYFICLDMVSEGVTWFEDRGSPIVMIPLTVTSDDPHEEPKSDIPAKLEARFDHPFVINEESDTQCLIQQCIAVRNTGDTTWLAVSPGQRGEITVGARFIDMKGRKCTILDAGRLLRDVRPGEKAIFLTTIPLPAIAGVYEIILDVYWERSVAISVTAQRATLTIPLLVPRLNAASFPCSDLPTGDSARLHNDRALWHRKHGSTRHESEEWLLAMHEAPHISWFREALNSLEAESPGSLPREFADFLGINLLPDAFSQPVEQSSVLFEDTIELIGYRCAESSVPAGSSLNLSIWWRTKRPLIHDLTAFIHGYPEKIALSGSGMRLKARRFGRSVFFQHDFLVGGPEWPSSCWIPGSPVISHLTLPIPHDIKRGDYTLMTGLWIAGKRHSRLRAADGRSDGIPLLTFSITDESL